MNYREAIEQGALFVANHSGGKDSQAMLIRLLEVVPKNQLIVVHASLGEVEWEGALEHARDQAEDAGLPFIVAMAQFGFRRQAIVKTLLSMVENRFKNRPEVPSWPSASTRQCTSDLKRGPIQREIRRYVKSNGLKLIVNCMGIRAQESNSRSKLSTWKRNKRQSVAGREWFDWLPIHHLSKQDVFETIRAARQKPHWAYAAGNERLSCVFCIMGSVNDLKNGAKHRPELFQKYVDLENKTGYTMHMSRKSLGEIVKTTP